MKAIIIQDKDAKALLDQLELKKLQGVTHMDKVGPPEQWISNMHRRFHYVVVNWLQEQGYSK